MTDRSFPCDICGAVLTRATILADHLRSHSDERPYQCSVCQKAFVRRSDCKQHEDAHLKEPQHICEWADEEGTTHGCGRRFRRMRDLKRHQSRQGASSCRNQGTDPVTQLPFELDYVVMPPGRVGYEPFYGYQSLENSMRRMYWLLLGRDFEDFSVATSTPSVDDVPLSNAPIKHRPIARTTHARNITFERNAQSTGACGNQIATGLPQPIREPRVMLQLTDSKVLLNPVNGNSETDILWRVALVAGFSFYKFLMPLAAYEAPINLPWLDHVKDFYWCLNGSTQRAILATNNNNPKRRAGRRPDLLFAIHCAVSVMADIAPLIGDETGTIDHTHFKGRLTKHLESGDSALAHGSGSAAGATRPMFPVLAVHGWEAADRYQIQLEQYLDTYTLGNFQQAQDLPLERGHPGYNRVHIRGPLLFTASQLAGVSMLRQLYSMAHMMDDGMSGQKLAPWLDYASL